MDELDKKLRDNPSTPLQERYYEFTQRNIGFDFVEKSSGRVFSKLNLWAKFVNAPRRLNLLSEGLDKEFIRRIKVGWIAVDQGYGPPIAQRKKEKRKK